MKSEWWAGRTVFAQPAEKFIPAPQADTIICMNCIDHAVGWREILANMARYARTPEAVVAITTDFHAPFAGHPGFDRGEFMQEIGALFAIIERHETDSRIELRLNKLNA